MTNLLSLIIVAMFFLGTGILIGFFMSLSKVKKSINLLGSFYIDNTVYQVNQKTESYVKEKEDVV